jgi:hypothetical protein
MSNHYYATGRGGAGNIQKTSQELKPTVVDQGAGTPTLLQPVFSTGRGGAGNMYKNTDPKIARLLQDVDPDPEDHITPVISGSNGHNNNMSIGRGGFGNMISPKNSASADQNKQRGKEKKQEKSSSSGGFFSKAKNLFKK